MKSNQDNNLIGLKKDVEYIKEKVINIERKVDSDYVTVDQHALLAQKVELVQKVVFGMIGTILIGFMGVLVNLAFNK